MFASYFYSQSIAHYVVLKYNWNKQYGNASGLSCFPVLLYLPIVSFVLSFVLAVTISRLDSTQLVIENC